MSEWTRSRFGHLYLDHDHTRYTVTRHVEASGPAGGFVLFRDSLRLNAGWYGKPAMWGWAGQTISPTIFSIESSACHVATRDIERPISRWRKESVQ